MGTLERDNKKQQTENGWHLTNKSSKQSECTSDRWHHIIYTATKWDVAMLKVFTVHFLCKSSKTFYGKVNLPEFFM